MGILDLLGLGGSKPSAQVSSPSPQTEKAIDSLPSSQYAIFSPRSPIYNIGINPSYMNLVADGYAGNSYVYAVINLITNTASAIPWKLTAYDDQLRENTVLDSHPLLDLIKSPNEEQGRSEFMAELLYYLLISGNAYIYMAGPDNPIRPPQELYNLYVDAVEPDIPQTSIVQKVNGYRYGTQYVTPEKIIWFKKFNPLQLSNLRKGMSPMVAGGKAIDLLNDAKKWNLSLLQNGASPTGVLQSDKTLPADVKARIMDGFKAEHAGASKAGNILGLLDGNIKYQRLSLTPEEMAWAELQDLSAREIAIVYSIPGQLVGIPDSQTYANMAEARKALMINTIVPILHYIRDKINTKLTPKFGEGLYLDINTDNIEELQESKDQLWARVGSAYKDGLISREEARSRIGLDPQVNAEETMVGGSVTE